MDSNETKYKEHKKDKKSKKEKKSKNDKKEKEKDPSESKYLNMDDNTKIYQEVDKIIAKLLSDKS